jgi:hypothetical protein
MRGQKGDAAHRKADERNPEVSWALGRQEGMDRSSVLVFPNGVDLQAREFIAQNSEHRIERKRRSRRGDFRCGLCHGFCLDDLAEGIFSVPNYFRRYKFIESGLCLYEELCDGGPNLFCLYEELCDGGPNLFCLYDGGPNLFCLYEELATAVPIDFARTQIDFPCTRKRSRSAGFAHRTKSIIWYGSLTAVQIH